MAHWSFLRPQPYNIECNHDYDSRDGHYRTEQPSKRKKGACSGHPLRWLFRAIGLHCTLLSHAYSCISLHIHTDAARAVPALFHVHYAGPLPSLSVDRDQPIRCFHLIICPVYHSICSSDLSSETSGPGVGYGDRRLAE